MKNQANALAAALSTGLLWGVGLFLWTFVSIEWGYASSWVDLLSECYPGYGATTIGAFWGLVWGFLDGFIGAYLLVWLYNFFVRHFAKRS